MANEGGLVVHFGSLRGPVGGRESPLQFSIGLHSEHVQGQGAGSRSMPYVESGDPTHAETDGQLRLFLAPEPGRAWLGPLWPNRGAGFWPQHVASRSSPHPSPGASKRGSTEPLGSLSVSLFFRTCLVYDCQNALLLLREPDPGRLPSFETPCRAVDVPPHPRSQMDQCGAHVATSPGK